MGTETRAQALRGAPGAKPPQMEVGGGLMMHKFDLGCVRYSKFDVRRGIKIPNGKTISFFNECLILLGFKPKMYSWIENGRPIYASVLMGESQVKDLINSISLRNPSKLKLLSRFL